MITIATAAAMMNKCIEKWESVCIKKVLEIDDGRAPRDGVSGSCCTSRRYAEKKNSNELSYQAPLCADNIALSNQYSIIN